MMSMPQLPTVMMALLLTLCTKPSLGSDEERIADFRKEFKNASHGEKVKLAYAMPEDDAASAPIVVQHLYEAYSTKQMAAKSPTSAFAITMAKVIDKVAPVLFKSVEDNALMKSYAIWAIARSAVSLEKEIKDRLTHKSAAVRTQMLHAIRYAPRRKGELGNRNRFFADVHAKLADEDVTVQFYAGLTLLQLDQMSGKSVANTYEKIYPRLEPNLRTAVIRNSRRGIGLPASLPLLELGLKDEEWRIRFVAATYIYDAKTADRKRLIPVFREAVRQGVSDSAAASYLAKYGAEAKDALPELRFATKSEINRRREAAALAILQIDPTLGNEMIPVLASSLKGPFYWNRRGVLDCIAEMGPMAKPLSPKLKELIDTGQFKGGSRSLEPAAALTLLQIDSSATEYAYNILRSRLMGDRSGQITREDIDMLAKLGEPLTPTLIANVQMDLKKFEKKGKTTVFSDSVAILGAMGSKARVALPHLRQRLKEARRQADKKLIQTAVDKIVTSSNKAASVED